MMTMARLKVMNLKENVHQDDIIKKIALVLQFKDRNAVGKWNNKRRL